MIDPKIRWCFQVALSAVGVFWLIQKGRKRGWIRTPRVRRSN